VFRSDGRFTGAEVSAELARLLRAESEEILASLARIRVAFLDGIGNDRKRVARHERPIGKSRLYQRSEQSRTRAIHSSISGERRSGLVEAVTRHSLISTISISFTMKLRQAMKNCFSFSAVPSAKLREFAWQESETRMSQK
jgi:hypothetical protein